MPRPLSLTHLTAIALLCASAAAQNLQLNQAIDYNPHPRVFETVLFCYETDVQLVDGNKTRMMVYNGSSPGPTIDAYVGDTLIVHFINLMYEPTTVHWHGIEMPAVMDGSHISQAVVPQFGYFRYEFKLNNAATYWYHPHNNTNQQIEKGLLGAVVVRDRKHERRLGIPRSRDRVVFLDDIKLDENNKVARFSTDPKHQMIPWMRAEDQANSRPGNHVLVNSQEVTDKKIPTIEVLSGAAYRLRFINPSSGAIFRLNIKDPKQNWYAVGSDQGLWNDAEPIKPIDKVVNPLGHHNNLISNTDERLGVTLTPGDRAEVVLLPEGEIGTEFFIEFHDFVKGNHVAFRDPQNNLLFGHDHFDGSDDPYNGIRVKIIGKAKGKPWAPKKGLRHDPIKPLAVDLNKPPLPIVFGHAFPDNVTGNVMFFVNVQNPTGLMANVRARKMTMPPIFGPKPMMMHTAIDGYHVKVGETRYWEVVNFTGGDHNFHTHGFRFQHIDTEYIDLDTPEFNRKEKPLRVAYEDTIRVPKRPGLILGRSFTIMRLAVRFDDSSRPKSQQRHRKELLAGGLTPTATTSGGWLVHCHFLEHAVNGMMSFITVTDK